MASEPAVQQRRRPASGGDRRPDIVSAAAGLFSVEGYHGTSMRDLARATGLQPGSLYSHFTGKDDLMRQVAERCLDVLEPGLAGAAAAPGDGAARLEALIAVTVEAAFALPAEFLTLSNHARLLQTAPEFAGVADRIAALRSVWEAVLGAGVADGSLRADLPVGAVLWLVFSAVTGVVDGRYGGVPGEAVEVVAALRLTLLDGIRAR